MKSAHFPVGGQFFLYYLKLVIELLSEMFIASHSLEEVKRS